MKYKMFEIPRPEWCQIGTVARVNGKEKAIIGYQQCTGEVLLADIHGVLDFKKTHDVEPVPA